MNRRTLSAVGIGLYVVAGLVTVYTVWALTHFHGYITEMMGQGQLVFSGNEFEIISFYVSNAGLYAVLAIILFALGIIVQRPAVSTGATPTLTSSAQVSDDEIYDDEDDDEFYSDDDDAETGHA